jgi:tetratricopeptide (TPR) repeat protein
VNYTERGLAYAALNQVDKALVDFDRALSLNPQNDQARAARGLALLLKGNSAEGLPDINETLERDPNNQVAQVGRGLAMLTSGQFDRAVVALDQVIAKSKEPFPRVLRARAYLAKGDSAAAMSDLNEVLALRPGDPEAHALRGIALLKMHDYDKALDDLNQALTRQPTLEGFFARAQVYEAQDNVQKATDDYRSASLMTPRSVFELLAQAQAKKKLQDLPKRLPCGSVGRASSDGTCL